MTGLYDWRNFAKSQAVAVEFVFSQLKPTVLSSYEQLIKEMKGRFDVIENVRVYKSHFSNRKQSKEKGTEEYAADLKRLYELAHPDRDVSTRQEYLLAKFLQGLWDAKIRQHVELHRDPKSIEDAVQMAVTYISMTSEENSNLKHVRQVKRSDQGGNRQNRKGNNKRYGNCFNCGKFRHFARDCTGLPDSEEYNQVTERDKDKIRSDWKSRRNNGETDWKPSRNSAEFGWKQRVQTNRKLDIERRQRMLEPKY